MWALMAGPESITNHSEVDAGAVRQELDRILCSAEFRASERRTRLLRYLVERAIAGEPVKEYAIGVDVFAKPPEYDPRTDPAVRVEMGRLRTRLREYYGNGGSDDEGCLHGAILLEVGFVDETAAASVMTTLRAGAPSRKYRLSIVAMTPAYGAKSAEIRQIPAISRRGPGQGSSPSRAAPPAIDGTAQS